ncbi:hypothetical protein N7467_004071 [Penicillium canescens]|nr:hypothetical protein N7467_004071 [Penicillium canescens]
MVTKDYSGGSSSDGSLSCKGEISREEILSRDSRKYRTDCSGFPGDFISTLSSGTSGATYHVTLFKSWADSSKEYNTLECRGTYGYVAYKRPIG